MKKVEVVIKSSAFDTFRESAKRLAISEYDVSDVRLAPSFGAAERRGFYRGQEYNLDLLSRVKIEFAVFDREATPIAQELLAVLAPDSIAISPLDEVISIFASVDQPVPLSRIESSLFHVTSITH